MSRRRDVLLDTGPLVALLDASDQWHEQCRVAWNVLGTRCITTEAVLTEATHLIERGGGTAHVPLDFLLSADVPIQGLETAGYRHAARLMRRYRDVPMDYADATLVVVAEALAITHSFTLDRKGFRAYKRNDGKGFEVVP